MSKKLKYIIGILLVLITVVMSILIVNLVEVKDDDAVKGSLVIWVEDNIYDYMDKSAKDFMEINGKVEIKIIKVNHDEIQSVLLSNDVPDIVQ